LSRGAHDESSGFALGSQSAARTTYTQVWTGLGWTLAPALSPLPPTSVM
jgi:hypothetical protein